MKDHSAQEAGGIFRFFLYVIVQGVCLLFFQPVIAQQSKDSTEKIQELGEVVISYNKWEQQLNEVPNKITKINRAQIQLQRLTCVHKAVRFLFKKVSWVAEVP